MDSLLLNFLEVSEKAAIEALPWVGSGNHEAADQAATTKMRELFNQINMEATVVIGEGEIDEAPMLYIGEKLGTNNGPMIDIAIDPIEGTTPTIKGQNNGMTVMLAAPKGSLLHAPDMYMKKIVVGPEAKGKIDISLDLMDNLKEVAKAKNKKINELNIAIQDRERHKEIINQIYNVGGKVTLFNDGDIIYSLLTCMKDHSIDMLIGVGGAPEGVITAAALKGLGGEIQAQLQPRNQQEKDRCAQMGIENIEKVLTHDDLINSDKFIFIATAITNNFLLKGIETSSDKYILSSLVLDGKGCIPRFLKSVYPKRILKKL